MRKTLRRKEKNQKSPALSFGDYFDYRRGGCSWKFNAGKNGKAACRVYGSY